MNFTAHTLLTIHRHLRDPLTRSGYLLMSNTLVTAALGMGYWVVAARLYPPESFGIQAALINSLSFLAGIADLNLGSALTRFLPNHPHAARQLVTMSYRLVSVLALLCGLAFIMVQRQFTDSLLSGGAAVWFIISAATWAIFSLQDHVLISLRQSVWVFANNVAFGVLKLILLVVFAVTSVGDGILLSWTVGLLLPLTGITLLLFARLLPPSSQPLDRAQGRAIIQFGLVDYTARWFANAQQFALPWLIVAFAGASANSYFSISMTIVGIATALIYNLTQAYIVEAATAPAELARYTRRIVRQALILGAAMTLALLLGAPLVLTIFNPSFVEPAAPLLRLHSLTIVPTGVLLVATGAARILLRRRFMIGVPACLLVATVTLTVALLPVVGVAGVGVALVTSYTAVALAAAVWLWRSVLHTRPRS